MIIVIALDMGWNLHQKDVKTSFINNVIKEYVDIEKPKGFLIHGKESHACRIKMPYMDSSKNHMLGMLILWILGEY